MLHETESAGGIERNVLQSQALASLGRDGMSYGPVGKTMGCDQDVADLLGVPVLLEAVPLGLGGTVAVIAQRLDLFRPSGRLAAEPPGGRVVNLDPLLHLAFGIALEDLELDPALVGRHGDDPPFSERQRVEVDGQAAEADVAAVLEHQRPAGLRADHLHPIGDDLRVC